MATISAAQLNVLRRAHEGTVYVYKREGGRPGSGVHRRTLDALRRAGLVRVGGYVDMKGCPLVVTTKGVALLIHLGQVPASPNASTEED
ncbi:hypothetical protein ABZW49_10560 [Nonomuraea wenchangensis]